MRRMKYSILALSIAAFLVTPLLSSAQITQGDLQNMNGTTSLLRQIQKTSPDYQSALEDAMRQCGQLGNKIYSLTRGVESTMFSGTIFDCSPAAVRKLKPGQTPGDMLGKFLNRTYAVDATNSKLEAYLISVERGTVDSLTVEKYTEMGKQNAEAGSSEVNPLNQAINWVVEGFGNVIASVLAGLAIMSLKLLNLVLQTTTTMAAPQIVDRGWVIIRDFMNLFFIVALIAMALATILRYEAYNYKRLLFQLVLMAILINFSKAIAEVLINFSDTLVALFQPSAGSLAPAQAIWSSFVTHGDGLYGYFGQGNGVETGIGNVIIKIAGLTLLAVSLAAIALLMFVRLVGLWFLVMISPIAYALNILPATQPAAKKWWTTFIKYLTWGPVAMFFFRISFTLMQENGNNFIGDSVLNSLFISAFVWGGYKVAKESGMHGADFVMSGADKALNKAKNWGKAGARGIGNSVVRGQLPGVFAGAAGAVAGRLGVRNASFKNWYGGTRDKVAGTTAAVSGAMKAPGEAIARGNRARASKIDEASSSWQRRFSSLQNLDKDSIKIVSPESLFDMAKNGDKRVTEGLVEAVKEHGTKGQIDALYMAMNHGHVTDPDMVEAVKRAHYLKYGGKETDNPDKYRNSRITVDVHVSNSASELTGLSGAARATAKTDIINDLDRIKNKKIVVNYQ